MRRPLFHHPTCDANTPKRKPAHWVENTLVWRMTFLDASVWNKLIKQLVYSTRMPMIAGSIDLVNSDGKLRCKLGSRRKTIKQYLRGKVTSQWAAMMVLFCATQTHSRLTAPTRWVQKEKSIHEIILLEMSRLTWDCNIPPGFEVQIIN